MRIYRRRRTSHQRDSEQPGVYVDSSNNVYISDTSNHAIRLVSGGVISTLAGDGRSGYSGDGGPATAAELYYPEQVAKDGAGNVYIADSGNCRIRAVNSAGTIDTVAGIGGPDGEARLHWRRPGPKQ